MGPFRKAFYCIAILEALEGHCYQFKHYKLYQQSTNIIFSLYFIVDVTDRYILTLMANKCFCIKNNFITVVFFSVKQTSSGS